MNEKVIHQIQVVETEDGFRVEIKGDKEALRHLFEEHGPFGWWQHFERHFRGYGPFGRHEHGPHEAEGRHGHGPFGPHEHGPQEAEGWHGHGPFGWRMPSPEEREKFHALAREWRDHRREEREKFRDFAHEWRRRGPSPMHGLFNWAFGFPFGGHEGDPAGPGEKAKRGYDLGPWWDEGEAREDGPSETV